MTARKPRAITDMDKIEIDESPFLTQEEETQLDALPLYDNLPHKKQFSWGKLFFGTLSILLGLAFALWVENLVIALFNQSGILGWLALIVALIAVLAFVVILAKEILAISRLSSVDHIRTKAQNAIETDQIQDARQAVTALLDFTKAQPLTTTGRRTMRSIKQEIIDGRALIELAEKEILRPLDIQARTLILSSAKRVSIVTAVSPRAIVDLGYVIYESSRLIRNLAELYGCRPGRFGYLAMIRRVLAHLAVTGTLALGDGLVQQLIGQGLASRLSARLGEGVVNGLMTTRIGIAAMDALRPFPFSGEKRPGISDFTSDLIGTTRKTDETIKQEKSTKHTNN